MNFSWSFNHASTCGREFLVVGSGADPGDAGGAASEHLGILLEELQKVAGEEQHAAAQQGAG